MALLTGQELADALDLDYVAPIDDTLDQIASASSALVGSLITSTALTAEPAACKEAALSVGVEIFQARTAAGGQAVATDFSPGPYRLSAWIINRIKALIAPYAKVGGMVG